jgi:ABC-2 type transport system ATP-binding protein
LLGPNGAGKTTTLRVLTCYLSPTSGTIRVKDLDINQNPLDIRQLMGYLPESAPLYTDMLVHDYLLYIASIRGLRGEKRHKRIRELADLCGINEVMHMSINELSKGYKQRVGLVHAMMSDPEILVLDEPTSGLDPNQIVEIRSLIKEIGREKTVILSTHILSEVEAACDRIIIINRGRLVADGTTQDLRSSTGKKVSIRLSLTGASYQESFTLLSSVPGVKEISQLEQAEQRGHREQSSTEPEAVGLRLVCDEDVRAEIYRRIKQEDWILLELLKERESLENIFRELTLTDQTAPDQDS